MEGQGAPSSVGTSAAADGAAAARARATRKRRRTAPEAIPEVRRGSSGLRKGRNLRPSPVADRDEPVEDSSPNGADARAAQAGASPESPLPLAGGGRTGCVAAAGAPWRAGAGHGTPLRRVARGRRGRLPALARDPADEGADDARGGAAAVAAYGRQARGVRAAPPARPAHSGERRR